MKVKIKVSVSIRWRESQKVIRKFQITVNDGNFTFFLSSDNKMIRMYRVALRRIFIAIFSFEFFFFFVKPWTIFVQKYYLSYTTDYFSKTYFEKNFENKH